MDPGDLRHRVTIQRNTPTEAGDSWVDERDQWAKIQAIAANKIVFLSAQGSKATHTVTFRRQPEVQIGRRFLFDGRVYHIVGVQLFDDDNPRQEAAAEVLQ